MLLKIQNTDCCNENDGAHDSNALINGVGVTELLGDEDVEVARHVAVQGIVVRHQRINTNNFAFMLILDALRVEKVENTEEQSRNGVHFVEALCHEPHNAIEGN